MSFRVAELTVSYELVGVTRDEGLATVGSCRCVLLKQDNAVQASRIYSIISHTNSDGSGDYTFSGLTDNDSQYMVFAIKLDTPQIRGVTNDTLQPVLE